MATWNAIYLRGALPAVTPDLLAGDAAVRDLGPWTELALPGLQSGEAAALALSASAPGEVIWAQLQTTASVLGLLHASGGRVLRRLEYADGTWRRVEGQPQAWEGALFSSERLEEALEDADEAEMRALFARRTLAAGAALPRPREFEALWQALGVTRAEWEAARAAAPRAVLRGNRAPAGTARARLLLAAGGALLLGAVAARGDARALCAALGLPVLLLALGAGFLRKLEAGRWFA